MRGNERVMHHYAAALNSVPIYDHAIRHPNDSWLWRLASCAGGGSLTNIREDGSASMGWHGDPDLLTRDAYSAGEPLRTLPPKIADDRDDHAYPIVSGGSRRAVACDGQSRGM